MLLIIFGCLGMVLQVFSIISTLATGAASGMNQFTNSPEFQDLLQQSPRMQEFMGIMGSSIFALGNAFFHMVTALLVIMGGYHLKEMKSYRLAFTGSLVAAIPCLGSCCCMEIPIGIWALVLLTREGAKDAFSE